MNMAQPTRTDERGGEYAEQLYHADVLAQSVNSLADLDAEAIAEYRALGFLAVAQALNTETVAHAVAGLSRIIDEMPEGIDLQFESYAKSRLDRMTSEERQDAVRKLMRFTDADERLHSVAHHPGILQAVRSILGTDDIVMLQDMALLKPPGGGREKPWHQDKAFFNLDLEAPVVGVWIAVDEATPENGCMHVIPGSHTEGPVPHFSRRDWQICDTDVATARDVAVPLSPGGLMFFDGYIHHGTPANRTDTRRRALQFHYVRADTVSISEVERLAVFGLEGRGAEC